MPRRQHIDEVKLNDLGLKSFSMITYSKRHGIICYLLNIILCNILNKRIIMSSANVMAQNKDRVTSHRWGVREGEGK